MALKDQYSPQSAPSPQGIPQSPQTTSAFILEMNQNQLNSFSAAFAGYMLPQQYVQLRQIQQQHKHLESQEREQNDYESKLLQATTSSLSQSIHISADQTIKEEENDSIIYEEDEHIDVDDQMPVPHNQSKTPQIPSEQLQQISFSITNILSDRYGRLHNNIDSSELQLDDKKFTSVNQQNQTSHSITSIFRPFEISKNLANNLSEKSAFTRFATSGDLLELNRAQQQAAAAAAAAVMMAERANFLNCFNPISYPRIHEEIINSTRKYKQMHSTTTLPPPSPPAALSIISSSSSMEKLAPLGSLCKTVSEIGQSAVNYNNLSESSLSASQTCLSSPPPSSVSSGFSTSSAGSIVTPMSPICRILNNSPQPIPPQSVSRDSGMESSDDTRSETSSTTKDENSQLWPAWVYCTRYSDRPSSGPRYRRPKQPKDPKIPNDDKRPRTAFSSDQLARLKREFNENRYLTERRRQQLSSELDLNEAQIKIWFQNKRAKIKKSSGQKNPLALQLMAQGLYNHSTVPLTKEEEELEMRMNGQIP